MTLLNPGSYCYVINIVCQIIIYHDLSFDKINVLPTWFFKLLYVEYGHTMQVYFHDNNVYLQHISTSRWLGALSVMKCICCNLLFFTHYIYFLITSTLFELVFNNQQYKKNN